MVISTHDETELSSLCHGITMVDENNKPISLVEEFDTDTFQCKQRGGTVVTAVGFAIPCSDVWRLERLLKRLPAVLHQFICFGDPDNIQTICSIFTRAQVDRYHNLFDVVNGWVD